MPILVDLKETDKMPEITVGGSLKYWDERALLDLGAIYNVKTKRSNACFSVPAPMIPKLFGTTKRPAFMEGWENHIDQVELLPGDDELPQEYFNRMRKLQIDYEAVDFYQNWMKYEQQLAQIKNNDTAFIDSILKAHNVDDNFFRRPPKPHQKAGLAFFFISLRIGSGHILLFDEMRTGKTKQIIDIARWLIREKLISGALLVVPNTIKRVWLNELRLDAPLYASFTTIIEGQKYQKLRQWQTNSLFYIVNYEACRADEKYMLEWQKKKLSNGGFLLVCDEAHKIKSPVAKQTQAIRQLQPKYSVLATGTPVGNRPEDAFIMSDFVCRGIMGKNIQAFQDQFGIRGGFRGKQITGYTNLKEITSRLARISLRRKRKDITFDEKILMKRYGEMKGDQLKAYKDMRAMLYAEATNSAGQWTAVQSANQMVKALRLLQITCGYLSGIAGEIHWFDNNWKLAEVDEFVKDYLDSVGKVVIWSRFVPPIEMMVERYKKHGAVKVRGQMKHDQGIENMYRFQRDPDCKIMLANLQSAEGKGFQPATVCIFYDKWWAPALNRQAEDRCSGIMNEGVPITSISLLTQDAIDDRWEFILSLKKEWSDTITGDQDDDIQFQQTLDKATFMYLLSNPAEAKEYEREHEVEGGDKNGKSTRD